VATLAYSKRNGKGVIETFRCPNCGCRILGLRKSIMQKIPEISTGWYKEGTTKLLCREGYECYKCGKPIGSTPREVTSEIFNNFHD